MDKVSVIMPCFNDGKYIYESVESVLNQTYKNIELIIIDDGSDDEDTFSALDSFTANNIIKIYTHENKGPAYARNLGIKIATGKYILCLDADDLIDPSYIEKAVSIMNENIKVGIVYCEANLFGEINKPLDLPPYSIELMLKRNLIFVTALFRKSDWEKVNGFDEFFIHGLEDYDFWLSLIELNVEVFRIPEVLFFYRKKEESRNKKIIRNKALNDHTLELIYKKHPSLFEKNKNIPLKKPVKKIFVCMYLVHNLGDDLFLDTLVRKYPNCQFTINYTNNDYDDFIANYNNLNRIIGVRDYSKIGSEYDAVIYIGGSLFQEVAISYSIYQTRMGIINQFKTRNKPVFMIGTNFGPYTTQKFFNLYENFLAECYDVCVRDKYSYNLLKHIPTVRYAPDIVFQSDFLKKDYDLKDDNTVGFSIMNFKKRDSLCKYHSDYISNICKSIQYLVDNGYSCVLMSFCENEGDLESINEIKSNLSNYYLERISTYNYTNNLAEAISLISSFKLFVSTRFHATILALGLGVGVLPIIYNVKTLNTLKDLELNKIIISLDNLELLSDSNTLDDAFNNTYLNKNICSDSIHHFDNLSLFICGLDKFLKDKPKSVLDIIYNYLDNKISIDGLKFYFRATKLLTSAEIKHVVNSLKLISPIYSNFKLDNNPLISIIIPVYNGAKHICKTIDSIIMQSYKNFEVVIIDDNSNDNSEQLIRDKYLSNPKVNYYKNLFNLDVGISRLVGYNLCNGDYVIFLDQDDFYIDKDFFKKCISTFSTNDNVSFVACNTFIYEESKKSCTPHKLNLPYNINRLDYFMNLQAPKYPKPTSTFPVMYSKKMLDIVKLNELEFVGDSSLYQRALVFGNPIILDTIVGAYRIHNTNSTYIVGPQFIIDTLNGHKSTKKLVINEFGYDKNEINQWFNLKADVSIGWYLNTHKVSYENALILMDWVVSNDVELSLKNQSRLESALKV